MSTVRQDFFLDPAQRLTEQERALMTAMLHCLVGDVADEIRAELPDGGLSGTSNAELVTRLGSAGLLDEPGLMALLLRRADEEQFAAAAKAHSGRAQARVVQALISQEDAAVSAAAMALILARGRRRDRFGQCLLHFDDLPADSAEKLVHAVAAALASAVRGTDHSALAASAGVLLQRRDPARSVDSLTGVLADLLQRSGQLEDSLIVAAAEEGEVALVAHCLAIRAGIDAPAAFDRLLSSEGRSVMLLLRMAQASRELAAHLLAGAGNVLGIEDVGAAMTAFAQINEAEVASEQSLLRLHPHHSAALRALAANDG